MPYGLSGELSHKRPILLTVDFLARIGTAPPCASSSGVSQVVAGADGAGDAGARGSAFASVLARLTIDGAKPSPKKLSRLAAAIRGDAPDESVGGGQPQSGLGKQPRAGSSATGVVSMRVPARIRGLYLQRDSPGLPPLTWGLHHGSRRFVQRHGCQRSAAGCIGRQRYCSASQPPLTSRLPRICASCLTCGCLRSARQAASRTPPELGSAPPPSPMSRFRALVEQAQGRRCRKNCERWRWRCGDGNIWTRAAKPWRLARTGVGI